MSTHCFAMEKKDSRKPSSRDASITKPSDLRGLGISQYDCADGTDYVLNGFPQQAEYQIFASSAREAVQSVLNKVDAFYGKVGADKTVSWALGDDARSASLYTHGLPNTTIGAKDVKITGVTCALVQ